MRPAATALALAACAMLLASDLAGQRRGRFRPRAGAESPPPAAPEAEAKKPKVAHWLAITGGDVHLGTGQMLRRATVLVGDDKIRDVGHGIPIPDGAEVLDAAGKVVAPGFIAVRASGLGEPDAAHDNVADAVNPFHPDIPLALAAGITSFLATFDSGSDKPGGRTAVLKLARRDAAHTVLAQDTVYSMRVPLDPAQWHSLRELVAKTKEALAKGEAPAAAPESEPKGEAETEEPPAEGQGRGRAGRGRGRRGGADGAAELTRVLQGKAVLWVSAAGPYDEAAIRQALEVARLLGRGVVLDNPITAWAMADEIAATGSMVVCDPRLRVRADPGQPDTTGSNIAAAAILHEAGVPVAVTPPGGRFGGATVGKGGILGQDLHTLHLDAGFAVRGGLERSQGLRTITLDAAKILGVADRVGSIEAGKDADLLILDGDPLHYATFVEKAIVAGKVVYEKDKEPFYSHIKR